MRDEQLQRPTDDDRDAWRAYWAALGLPWRTEPEIGAERQAYLAERRAVTPDIEHGIYPFKDVELKLTRADVEWLLATHESGGYTSPVDWSDPKQREREGLDLRGADLREVDLSDLPLARLRGGLALDDWARATPAQGEAAAVLLQDANLRQAQLQGAYLTRAQLHGATLRLAFLDAATYLNGIVLGDKKHGIIHLVDVRWGGANLAVVDWAAVHILGDEQAAWEWKLASEGGVRAQRAQARLNAFRDAVRGNRQLAKELRDQGLNEDADRFAYRAQVLQREVFRRQRQYGRFLGWGILDLIAGHGYKPLWSFITYAAFVLSFAFIYYLLRVNVSPTLNPVDALIFSITSFHGRGFSPGAGMVTLHNPLTILAAVEAIIGLLIEITFIATFTQRFFAR
jgi:hypothetical protein